jgi:hypothetical protein
MAGDVELLRDKNVVAVIDFRQTTIYPTDASPGQQPEHLVAPDPRGRFYEVHSAAAGAVLLCRTPGQRLRGRALGKSGVNCAGHA